MISYLEGKVKDNDDDGVTLVSNNVGFLVNIPASISVQVNDDISLYVRTIVRENDISLYGFETKEDRKIFDKLITVKGVGPKAAINILGNISALNLASAIIDEDASALKKIKGLGPKTADTVIFTLKDKLKKEYTCVAKSSSDTLNKNIDDIMQSLLVLGYTSSQAEKVINTTYDDELSLQENIKNCLKNLRK